MARRIVLAGWLRRTQPRHAAQPGRHRADRIRADRIRADRADARDHELDLAGLQQALAAGGAA